MASGALTSARNMTSRARCMAPCSEPGSAHELSVSGLSESAYAASELMLTTCATEASARTMARAMIMFSTSIAESLTGARADAATAASPGLSNFESFSAASGESKSTSFLPTRSTGTPSRSRRAATALPTKPAAPMTTTRSGFCGALFRCSSMSEGMNLQAGCLGAVQIKDRIGIEHDAAAQRLGDGRAVDLVVLRPRREDQQRIGPERGLERGLEVLALLDLHDRVVQPELRRAELFDGRERGRVFGRMRVLLVGEAPDGDDGLRILLQEQ